jgi:hypothetical protein
MQGENILLYTSAVMLFSLTIVAYALNGSAFKYLFSKDQPKYFDKNRLPRFFGVLGISAVCLLVYALFFTSSLVLILQFVLGNLFFVGVAAVTLILYRNKKRG